MFKNASVTNFALAENREKFNLAISKVLKEVGEGALYSYPIISGEELAEGQKTKWISPNSYNMECGTVYWANKKLAEQALKVLEEGQVEWGSKSIDERAEVIEQAANLLEERRFYLAAVECVEVGKPWAEADADVVEAIDFCRFYAYCARKYLKSRVTQKVLGEDNVIFYKPRGITVVISPWNFPLAIPCGMTVAGLVSGNAVILKPAEQSSLIGAMFARILLEAGVPANAFAFLPGKGEEIGDYLVTHKKVHTICFTGSKKVGVEIYRKASVLQSGQEFLKKVIAEMGGKNAIIVDEDADLDEAVKGVIYSAFGFSGQKCSACSRVITVGGVTENFLKRLKGAAESLIIGSALDPSTMVGPVIDREAQERILNLIKECEKEHKVLFKSEQRDGGCYVPVAIFQDVDVNSILWREEHFAPILAHRSVKTFKEALELANSSQYALTGGVYSRLPSNIELARKEFLVGNLYINRGITGAIVERQPFGGFKLSGVGSKAGGTEYLYQFVEPRVVSENITRRGFVPDV